MAHDTHHHNEGKKAVFGPPVIMGLAFWLFAFFFLSLCDGKEGNNSHDAHSGHDSAKTEQVDVKKAEEPVKTEEHAH